MSNLVLYAIPAFIISVLLEIQWARRHPEYKGYETRDTFASLSMGLTFPFPSPLVLSPRHHPSRGYGAATCATDGTLTSVAAPLRLVTVQHHRCFGVPKSLTPGNHSV